MSLFSFVIIAPAGMVGKQYAFVYLYAVNFTTVEFFQQITGCPFEHFILGITVRLYQLIKHAHSTPF
jgi:hypothetical protein